MILTKNKVLCTVALVLGILAIEASASPMLTISDNAAVYFIGSAAVTSDSNVAYSNTDELDDIIIDIRPGLELMAGSPDVGFDFSLSASYGFRRYMDYDEFNTDLPAVVAAATFKSAKSTTKVNASYVETQAENRRATRGIVLKSAITSLGISEDIRATAKSSFVGGINYSDTDHKIYGTDNSSLSIPLNVYYAATEKLDAGFGYRYRKTSVDSSLIGDRDSHFFNFGLRGELTPKLVADLKLGYQTTDIDGGDKINGLGLDAKLTFSPDEKTSADFVLSKDVLVGFAGDVIDNTSAALVGSYRINPALTARATLVVGNDSYSPGTREDDYTILQIGASYAPIYFMSVDAMYSYTDNDSNVEGLDFKKNTLQLSVNVRY